MIYKNINEISFYQAYKIWKHENGEEPKLPDLDYTSEQLFFINFGRVTIFTLISNLLLI